MKTFTQFDDQHQSATDVLLATNFSGVRTLSYTLCAAGLTLGIFWGMNALINPDGELMLEESSQPTISITRKPRDETTKQRTTTLPPPPEKAPPPPPPALATTPAVINGGGAGYKIEIPSLGKLEISNTDRRAIPIIKFPPEYPQRELMRNVEGFVLLQFTITVAGTVENIEVLNADPPGAFETAASRALSRWKYQPKMVDGNPVAQPKMQEVFRFEIVDKT